MRDPESRLPPEDFIRARVKVELRKRLRGVRATMPLEACAKRSAEIVKRLEALPVFQVAKRVALFWPIVERREVDLRPLDPVLRARGASVAYPAIDPETGAMTFRFAAPEELEERGYNFAEPPPTAPEADGFDVVVVPAVAIDPVGHRIGYGAGYYDRTLPKFCPPALAIGVAYDFQLVAEVPFNEFDAKVGYVVTDGREIDPRATAE
ncbi:MAG TPA: 5-formyltetrahydrofolate cyclo-ligase [Polyangiaceae bacterium]|jgi:5-formyltetrahydrofolate cyclo-ligase